MSRLEELAREKLGMSLEEFQSHLEKLPKTKVSHLSVGLALEKEQMELSEHLFTYKQVHGLTWQELANYLYVSVPLLRKFCNRERNFDRQKMEFIRKRLQGKGIIQQH